MLLHGNGESSDYFVRQTEEFARRFCVIAPDTRGHGASPRGSAPFTLCQFAEDLKNLLDDSGIKSADILGFSDGANIALLFALKYPRYVNRLVLNGGNLFPAGVKLWAQIPICIGYGVFSALSLFDRRAQPKKELLGLMVTQPHISPRQLAQLHVPTLVIAGTRDMIRPRHTRLIANSIPGARLKFLQGSHFVAAENSAEFNREVLDFLNA